MPQDPDNVALLARAQQIASEFELDRAGVRRITRHLTSQISYGLQHDTANQIPSFVTKVPDGTETGTFLAVDLGGTKCRVSSVELNGDSTYTLHQTTAIVPREVTVNESYRPLFDFIAEKIAAFLKEHPGANASGTRTSGAAALEGVSGREYRRKLGFTFSFTYEQHSLSRGTILSWDKGWNISEAIGKDPCLLLQQAIDKANLPVLVTVLANDSVCNLLARAYTSSRHSKTLIAAIWGTGTNAAYVERLSNITKLHGRPEFSHSGPNDLMLINTEWGSFDETLQEIPSTRYDEMLDKISEAPGSQMLEKRMSGMYLGELLRLVILQMIAEGYFEATSSNSPISRPYGIDSSFLSQVAQESGTGLPETITAIKIATGLNRISRDQAVAMRLIAKEIARRAGRLSGAALAAIIIHSGQLQSSPRSAPLQDSKVAAKGKRSFFETTANFQERNSSGFFYHMKAFALRLVKFFDWNSSATYLDSEVPSDTRELHYRSVRDGRPLDIGVEGSLVEFYPFFEEDIRGALRDITEIGPEVELRISMGLVKDGSSLGAALMAQAASVQRT